MSITRLTWFDMVLLEEDRRIVKRNAYSARIGQASDKDYQEHMRT